MPQSDLPLEVSQLPLSFGELIKTLRQLEGSLVIVSIASSLRDGSTLSAVGSIRPAPSSDIDEFWIGEPQNINGSHLRLAESSFRNAWITTFDGNHFFIIYIGLEALEIRIQDEASGAP